MFTAVNDTSLAFPRVYAELFILVFIELRPGLNDLGHEKMLKKFI